MERQTPPTPPGGIQLILRLTTMPFKGLGVKKMGDLFNTLSTSAVQHDQRNGDKISEFYFLRFCIPSLNDKLQSVVVTGIAIRTEFQFNLFLVTRQ